MRKLMRSVARAKMKKAGVQHMNRPVFIYNPSTKMVEKHNSYFADNWRKYVFA